LTTTYEYSIVLYVQQLVQQRRLSNDVVYTV